MQTSRKPAQCMQKGATRYSLHTLLENCNDINIVRAADSIATTTLSSSGAGVGHEFDIDKVMSQTETPQYDEFSDRGFSAQDAEKCSSES